MEFMDDASTIERGMIQMAKRQQIPINGSLELLPLCNMDCDMCYVRLSREEMEQKGRLRTVKEWLSLARQMEQAGVLFLLLTGGEPLLFPGFQELYIELKKMGMILTINTNGTLMNEEWAKFFGKYKPRRINITLYGANDETYETLCHYPKGFSKVVEGIRLLREQNVDVKVSCSVTKDNINDIDKIFEIGHELGVPVHADTYMMPAVRERTRPFHEQTRLLPEQAAAVSLAVKKKELSEDFYKQYVRQTIERIENPAFPRGDTHVSCLAGNCSFTINWLGEMRPCVVLSEPSCSVFEVGFDAAWQEIRQKTRDICSNVACTKCKWKPVCRTCIAAALLETGSYDGIPQYLCQWAQEYEKLLLKEERTC